MCDHTHYILEKGFLICTECGEILSQEFADSISNSLSKNNEIKYYSNKRTIMRKKDFTNLPNKDLFCRLERLEKWSTTNHERQMHEYINFLVTFKAYFPYDIPLYIIDDCNIIHEKICKLNLFAGRNRKFILTSLIYLVSVRIHGLKYLLNDFRNPEDEKEYFVKEMNKGISMIMNNIHFPQIKKNNYLDNLHNAGAKLGFSLNRIRYAKEFLKEIEKRTTITKSHVACALYVSGKSIIDGAIQSVTQKSVADILSIAQVTVQIKIKAINTYWKNNKEKWNNLIIFTNYFFKK